MSILRDFRERDVDTFPGSDSRTEPRKNIRAQVVKNVHFELDHPRTRTGLVEFDEITNVDLGGQSHGLAAPTKHYTFDHFIAATWERFVCLADNGSNRYLYYSTLVGTASNDIIKYGLSSSLTNAVTTTYGSRFYAAFTKDDGTSLNTQQGIVWDGRYTGSGPSTINTDSLFQVPWNGAITVLPTETNPQPVTAGVHKFGIVYVTRNGYETRPQLLSDITATGDLDINIQLTPSADWPDWVLRVKPIITTVQNPELYYFVPNTSLDVTPGTTTPVNFLLVDSDVTISQWSEATDWFSLTTSTEIGAIKFVDTYGDRLVYVVDRSDASVLADASSIWFSDVGDPERVAADRNQRFLPNKKPITGGKELNGVYYVFGPNWTYAFTETTDFPVTWFPAQEISGSVGIKYPGCVAVNSTNSMLWVAHTSGLYTFNGQQYNDLPASYRNPVEWDRINWAAPAWCFKLIDDEVNEQVMFQVPLDAAVKPTHVLKWNYSRGFSRDHVRFSIDNYSDGEGALTPIIEIAQHPTTKLSEVWVADADDPVIYRTKNVNDTTPFNDDGAGIDSVYRSEALSPVGPAPLKHGGTHFRLTGAGDAEVSVYSYDQYRLFGPVTRDLDVTKRGPYLVLLGWQSETAYLEVSNDAVANAWWQLGSITHYYSDWLAQR